jgi:hypothetical protein
MEKESLTEAAGQAVEAKQSSPEHIEVTFRVFLEEIPPDTTVIVTDVKVNTGRYLLIPDIALYCTSDRCAGVRFFKADSNPISKGTWHFRFVEAICRNCSGRLTRFAIAIKVDDGPTQDTFRATCTKIGQIPPFGPQTPPRVLRLVQPDSELFLQGRRAEMKGLGIGAFAYYRRVVENQKTRIIGEIAKVAKTLGSSRETDMLFLSAQRERSFERSIVMVKDVIPHALMISGHNPLTLLHTALSKGLHDPDMSDDRCLQLAQSIRTILVALAEKTSEVLKNDKEIQTALSTLLAAPPTSEEGTKPKPS